MKDLFLLLNCFVVFSLELALSRFVLDFLEGGRLRCDNRKIGPYVCPKHSEVCKNQSKIPFRKVTAFGYKSRL
jgi:hypothetical protein